MKSFSHWTDRHFQELKTVGNFYDIRDVAVDVIGGMRHPLYSKTGNPIYGISGPVTTGGHGLENNLEIIRRSIIMLNSHNFNVFDITPLELGIKPLKEKWLETNTEYCKPILEIVYRGIFERKFFKKVFKLPNIPKEGEFSVGATWEDKIFLELGISTIKFPKSWYYQILRDLKIEYCSEVVLL